MYSLTIHFGPSAMVWQFLFKEEKKPGEAYNAFVTTQVEGGKGGVLIGSDDFGQSYAIPFNEISGMLIEDLDLVEEAQIQRSLVNARAQAKLNSRASQDPTLRAAQAMRGPAMIQPMGRG